jgi:hypothetical protein
LFRYISMGPFSLFLQYAKETVQPKNYDIMIYTYGVPAITDIVFYKRR